MVVRKSNLFFHFSFNAVSLYLTKTWGPATFPLFKHFHCQLSSLSLSLFYIRMVGPCIQCILIGMGWLQRLWSIVVDVVVHPLFLSTGRCCRGFSIHLADKWGSCIQTGAAQCVYECAAVHHGLRPRRHSFLINIQISVKLKPLFFLFVTHTTYSNL